MTATTTALLIIATGEGALALGALWMWWRADKWRIKWQQRAADWQKIAGRWESIADDWRVIVMEPCSKRAPLPTIPADYDETAALDIRRANRADNQARSRKAAETKRQNAMKETRK